MVVANEIDPLALEPFQRGDLLRRDQTAPDVGELALRAVDADLHVLHMRSRLLEGRDGLVDHRDHAWVDREDAVVARVGDPFAGHRAAKRGHEVDLAVDAIGIA